MAAERKADFCKDVRASATRIIEYAEEIGKFTDIGSARKYAAGQADAIIGADATPNTAAEINGFFSLTTAMLAFLDVEITIDGEAITYRSLLNRLRD